MPNRILLGALSALFMLAARSHAADLPTGVQCKLFYDTSVIHYSSPVWFGVYPGVKDAFMVGEEAGGLNILEPEGSGYRSTRFALLPTWFLAGNDGLLGLAFHPDFPANRKYYVYYSLIRGVAVLEERQATADFRSDAAVSRILLRHEFKDAVHNGGDIHFGADGFLYLGLGDAGNPMVYNTRSQELNLLAGKMLRIDIDRKDPGLEYAIPADNPYFNDANPSIRKEIYAYGLRQPWRWSFDPADGRLIVGDVGDWVEEEVDVIRKGGNYGWSRMEGNTCFNGADELSPLDHCDTTGLIPPTAVIRHTPISNSPTACIIGGHVFRGDPGSEFHGAYIFGDWQNRKIYGVRLAPGTAGQVPVQIGLAPDAISTFGTDSKGNIYVAGINSGLILRLEHPGLIGKGLAIRRPWSLPAAQSPRRIGSLWRIDPGSFPGQAAMEGLSVLSLDGKEVRRFGASALAAGFDLDLPQGLYVGRSTTRGTASAFPLVLR